MNRSPIPPYFAVVRTQSVHGPSFQILQTRRIRRTDSDDAYHLISPGAYRDIEGRFREFYNIDRNIYIFRYSSGNQGIMEYKFWYLPFSIPTDSGEIPILEFQYKSWLPIHYSHIPIRGHIDRFMSVFEEIHQQRSRQLQEDEEYANRYSNNNNRQFFEYHFNHNLRQQRRVPEEEETMHNLFPVLRTPQRQRRLSRIIRNTSAHPNTEYMTSTTTTTTNRNIPLVIDNSDSEHEEPRRVVVTITNTQKEPIPLPKPIGLLILANARTTEDSCPIAAQPYKECSKLSVCSCFHVFDSESINRWKETNNICPVCRTNIVNIVVED